MKDNLDCTTPLGTPGKCDHLECQGKVDNETLVCSVCKIVHWPTDGRQLSKKNRKTFELFILDIRRCVVDCYFCGGYAISRCNEHDVVCLECYAVYCFLMEIKECSCKHKERIPTLIEYSIKKKPWQIKAPIIEPCILYDTNGNQFCSVCREAVVYEGI